VVDSMNLFTTAINTADNRTIIVPNSAITGGNIINFSNKPIRRVDHIIRVKYEDDIKKVKEALYGVLASNQYAMKDPKPLVAISELGESSVNFTVRAWVKTENYWDAHFELIEQIKLAFDTNDITAPYPHFQMHP